MPGKMVSVEFDINNPPPLTDEDIAELEKLAAMPDDEIDFSDIPPLTDEFFKNAIRNPFLYPPVRISADVVEYFQEKVGPGRSIMMEINHVLLDYIAQQKAKAKKAG
jgi:uncharacterized protein (DUF4415 family)